MSKARTLAGVVSTGAVLADGVIDAAEIGNLTLPTGGDIVGTTASQTLTGKTIAFADNTLTGVQAALTSGTTIKTVNSTSLLGSGDVAVQATLVSGNNIKTISGTSVLGSGDITLATVATSGAYNDLSGKPSANDFLPTQTDNGGKYLTTNGTSAAWSTVAINQSTLVADGVITAAGKALILTAAGKAKQSVIASASNGSNTTFNAAKTSMAGVVYHPVANVFVIFYQDTTDSNKGKAKIATVASNNTVTFSSAFTFYDAAIYTGSINACFDSVTNQILIAFSLSTNYHVQVVAATVSGSTITYGTVGSTGFAGYEVGISYDTGVSKFLLAYRTDAQYALVGTVSGTSVSFGSPTTVYGSSVNGYGSPTVYCPSISTHCIGYNTGGRGYIIQITINPTTFAITKGSAYPITNGSGADGYLSGNHSLAWINSLQRLVVIHGAGPSVDYDLHVTMFYVSGNSWLSTTYTTIDTGSFGAPYQWWPSIDYSDSSGYVIISYVKDTTQRGFISFSNTLTDSSIGFGTKTQFQSTATDMTGVAISTTNNKALVVAFDNGNPSPAADLNGTCVGASAPLADLRTSFIGFSTASANDGASVTFTTSFGVDGNQTGLTPNQTYYLDSSNGTTLTTTVSGPKVARAISATSVQVLGPNCS